MRYAHYHNLTNNLFASRIDRFIWSKAQSSSAASGTGSEQALTNKVAIDINDTWKSIDIFIDTSILNETQSSHTGINFNISTAFITSCSLCS